MRVTLESTEKMVQLVINGVAVPARIWEGVTASGVRLHCYITRVAVGADQDTSEFVRDLQEHRVPSPEVAAISMRLVI